ncbi:S8 family peptidase [Motilibacter aurantiacus]|uniref:S8 family peptidase n=1 Tax=Motilibacter aurantiacus TaxID=2714955 RepID=UPI001E3A74A1|nr:S8 family peptidase [Motilibacter aurantiacus]
MVLLNLDPASAASPAEQQVVVQLRPGADRSDVIDLAEENGGNVRYEYSRALNGFSGSMTSSALAALRQDPDVLSVAPDREMTISATQPSAPEGLDRIDQRAVQGDRRYSYTTDGTGVTAYVVDTGIRTTHRDFNGRASTGVDLVDGRGGDCNGHGTHVAGTIGGRTFGVAKNVTLVAVRVLDCAGSGRASTVIAGLDWIATHTAGPAVVNLSFGGGADTTVDDAVTRLTAAGITVVAAAGNEMVDACSSTPARAPSAITVGAAYSLALGSYFSMDMRAFFSNHGPCLDVFAPGFNVISDSATSDTATAHKSGTSMAAPHVSGAVARYLQGHPAARPEEVSSAISSTATRPVLDANSGNAGLLYAAPSS